MSDAALPTEEISDDPTVPISVCSLRMAATAALAAESAAGGIRGRIAFAVVRESSGEQIDSSVLAGELNDAARALSTAVKLLRSAAARLLSEG